METLIQLGQLHQLVWVSGYIPQNLVLAVTSEGDYITRFNIRTFDNDGYATLLPCVAYGDTAKNLCDQFRNRDSLSIIGQLKPRYAKQKNDMFLTIKVLSYSITAMIDLHAEDGIITEEKKQFVEWALQKFDKNAPKPTDEEVKYWRENWKNYRKEKKGK